MTWLAPLRIALQFLTRLPVPVTEYRTEYLRESIYWYAVVGSVIGLILWLAQTLLLAIFPWDADLLVSVLLLVL